VLPVPGRVFRPALQSKAPSKKQPIYRQFLLLVPGKVKFTIPQQMVYKINIYTIHGLFFCWSTFLHILTENSTFFTLPVIFPGDSDILVWSKIHERRNFCWFASMNCLISLICLLLSNNVQRLECSTRVRKVLKERIHRKNKRTWAFQKSLLSCPCKKRVFFESHTINMLRSILQPSAMSVFEKSSNVRTTLQNQPSFLFTDKQIIETFSS
jgi:hypothetical protein